jgi:carboxylesterase type B
LRKSKENLVKNNVYIRLIQAVSDFLLNDPALEMANIRTKHGDDVYNFVFSYYRKGTLGMLGSIVAFEGATHCMELPYIFGISLLGDFQVVDEDEEIMDRFLTYLTTFMKTG